MSAQHGRWRDVIESVMHFYDNITYCLMEVLVKSSNPESRNSQPLRRAVWPLVSVIIVNWDGLNWLKICLPSLSEVSYPNLEIIIVDNGSDDGSVRYIEEKYPQVLIIRNQTNHGFAAPNNQGIALARGQFVMFLNNDMRFDANFIEPLVQECQKEGIGAAQPKIVLLDDKQRLDSVGSYLTVYGVLLHYGFGKKASKLAYNKSRDIFSAKGAALMVRRDVLANIGGFDQDFFAYFEETDLCWRIWLAGLRIRYVPRALVFHGNGQTAQRINILTYYHSFKNRLATLIKNLSFWPLVQIVPLHLCLMMIVSFAYLVTGKVSVFWAIWRAIGWNIRELRSTVKKRNHVQSVIRKIPDMLVLRHLMRPLPLSYFYYLFVGSLDQWREPDNL